MTGWQKGKIILIVGLPGSGKTMLGQQLAQGNAVLLDDLSNIGGLDAVVDKIKKLFLTIVITDPHLCSRAAQNFAKSFFERFEDYEVEWIFFENNIEACRQNIIRRTKEGDTRRVDIMLERAAKQYFIPDGASVISVWHE